jgi:hypothetical protein
VWLPKLSWQREIIKEFQITDWLEEHRSQSTKDQIKPVSILAPGIFFCFNI